MPIVTGFVRQILAAARSFVPRNVRTGPNQQRRPQADSCCRRTDRARVAYGLVESCRTQAAPRLAGFNRACRFLSPRAALGDEHKSRESPALPLGAQREAGTDLVSRLVGHRCGHVWHLSCDDGSLARVLCNPRRLTHRAEGNRHG